MKKVVCLILCLTVLVSCFCTVALAAATADVRGRNPQTPCDFAYDSGEGYSLGMKITDAANKTAGVVGFTTWPKDPMTLTIPQTVENDGTVYTVTSVENYAFGSASAADDVRKIITEVVFPKTIKKIGAEAFKYSHGLLKFSSDGREGALPSELETLGDGAFFSCSALVVDLMIPQTLAKIPSAVFANCQSVKSITIADGVEQIGYNAFRENLLVQTLKLPESVTVVDLMAFERMKGLRSLYFEQLKAISFTSNANTAAWKYPTYPNINNYGGCMGGTHASLGYTLFYARSSAVMQQLKDVMTGPINAGSDEETKKCKEYFLENNFVLDDSIGSVSITAPLGGETVKSLPLTVSGTAKNGDSVNVLVNGRKVSSVNPTDGLWSCELADIPSGTVTISAELEGGGKLLTAASVTVNADSEINNSNSALIKSGKYYDYDTVLAAGGAHTYDTLQLGYNRKVVDVNYSFELFDAKEKQYMFDAWKDVTTGNSLRLPTGESSIDIVLNDSYSGGREIADMFLVFKNLKQQYGNYYEVNILKSTTDKPDDFASIYKYSAKTELEDAYTYVRLTDFKKATANIKTIRINVRWTGDTPLNLCEFDFNDKVDCESVANGKKHNEEMIRMPGIFSNNMVFQRSEPITVWGKGGKQGETVTVNFDGTEKTATCDNGRWSVTLDPMNAGGPYTLTVSSSVNTLTFNNVMVGEVWLASGQSNMAYEVSSLIGNASKADYIAPYGADTAAQLAQMKADLANSADENLRIFTVGSLSSSVAYDDVISGKWFEASPDTVKNFSATAYYFAREMRKKLGDGVPFAIVSSSYSGSGIEKWVNDGVINSDKAYEVYKNGTQSGLYNGMINPILNYRFKGVIWYQGESNNDRFEIYECLFPAMIASWRKEFKNENMPFAFVNIAPYKTDNTGIREAQLKSLLTTDNTAMVVTTDAGDPLDIHPKYKKPVGERLCLAAMALAYGSDEEYSGPVYKSMETDGNALVLTFEHADDMKTSDGAPLCGFQLTGDGINFVDASAEIRDGKVLVSADGITEPVGVRYAWTVDKRSITDPLAANLCNGANLPAVPFRASADGFEISECEFSQSAGNVSISAKYKNNSTMNTRLMLCAYDKGGNLAGTKIVPTAFNYVGSCTLDETFAVSADVSSVKVIAVNGLLNLKPLCVNAAK